MKCLRVGLLVLLLLGACCFVPFVSAQDELQIEPDVKLMLPAYNTTVEANQSLYCANWTWNDVNATAISFMQAYTRNGTPVSNLTLSFIAANLTLVTLNDNGTTVFQAVGNSAVNISLWGFDAAPEYVLFDNLANTSAYSYDDSVDLLVLFPIVSGNVTVTLFYGADVSIGAFALVIGLCIFGLVVLVLFSKRTKGGDATEV